MSFKEEFKKRLLENATDTPLPPPIEPRYSRNWEDPEDFETWLDRMEASAPEPWDTMPEPAFDRPIPDPPIADEVTDAPEEP